MPRRKVTSQEGLYVNLLLDFVNEENTNHIGLKYIKNLQIAFKFSDEFSRQARNNFIVVEDISKWIEFRTQVDKMIDESSIQIYHVDDGLLRIGKKHHIKPFSQTEVLMPQSDAVLAAEEHYEYIWKVRRHLVQLLNSIINGHLEVEDSPMLDEYINYYSQSVKITFDENFAVSEVPLFDETEYYVSSQVEKRKILDQYYKKPISFCLVTLLKNPAIRRLVKLCGICQKYFLAQEPRTKFCSQLCFSTNQRRYHKKDMNERRDPSSPKFNPKYIR